MLALVRSLHGARLKEISRPVMKSSKQVLLKVETVGICRTDILAANGKIAVAMGRVLGHEFSAIVKEARESPLKPGDRVGINPLVACQKCPACRQARSYQCSNAAMLGLQLDGAMAAEVAIEAKQVLPLPGGVKPVWAAYLEPVAAALGIFENNVDFTQPTLVIGRNRFATLLQQLFKAKSLPGPTLVDLPELDEGESHSYPNVIETSLARATLCQALRLAAPGGTLVLKSRPRGNIDLDLSTAQKKNLRLQCASYGSFEEAAALLPRLDFNELVGDEYPLHQFSRAFEASQCEEKKQFLKVEH